MSTSGFRCFSRLDWVCRFVFNGCAMNTFNIFVDSFFIYYIVRCVYFKRCFVLFCCLLEILVNL